MSFQQRLDVLRDDVELEIYWVSRTLDAEGRDLGGVRDDGDREAVAVERGDREADAVDGDFDIAQKTHAPFRRRVTFGRQP